MLQIKNDGCDAAIGQQHSAVGRVIGVDRREDQAVRADQHSGNVCLILRGERMSCNDILVLLDSSLVSIYFYNSLLQKYLVIACVFIYIYNFMYFYKTHFTVCISYIS